MENRVDFKESYSIDTIQSMKNKTFICTQFIIHCRKHDIKLIDVNEELESILKLVNYINYEN